MAHTCRATGCAVQVSDAVLMCKNHWFRLPKPMRDAIYETCRAGQRNGTHPTRDYAENVRNAVALLADRDAGAPAIVDGVAIPAITVWQPWASLIAIKAKPLEFRRWPAPRCYQGKRIAIQAGARPVRKSELEDLIEKLRDDDEWRATGLRREAAHKLLVLALHGNTALPLSGIVCTAMLGVPIVNGDVERVLGLEVINDSDRDEHSNYGWPLSDVRVIDPPIPCRGSQGFFKVTVPGAVA